MGRFIDPREVSERMVSLGFVTIPLGQPKDGEAEDDGKAPWVKWRDAQHQATRPSPEKIAWQIERNAHHCDAVAILHGETNGTICVDADTTEDRDKLFAAFPDAPWKVISGKGGHVIFRPPPGVDQKTIRPDNGLGLLLPTGEWINFDLKPQGSYSIAPGSWHKKKGRRYEAPRPWLVEDKKNLPVFAADFLIREGHGDKVSTITVGERAARFAAGQLPKPPQAAQSQEPRRPTTALSSTNGVRRASAYMAKVDGVCEGNRGTACFKLACVLVRDFAIPDRDAFSLLSQWNSLNAPPLTDREIDEKIGNAHRYGRYAEGSKLVDRPRSRPQDPSQSLVEALNDGEPEEEEPSRESKKRSRRLDEDDYARLLGFAKANKNAQKALHSGKWRRFGLSRLAERCRTVANCGKVTRFDSCGKHGPLGISMKPCDDELMCPTCAERWFKKRTAKFVERWKDGEFYLVRLEVPQGDRSDNDQRDALRSAKKAEIARLKGLCGKSMEQGLVVEGSDHVLVLYPRDGYEQVFRVAWPDAKVVKKPAAAKAAAYAYYQTHEHFKGRFFGDGRRGDLIDVLHYPWHERAWLKRVSNSKKLRARIPWLTIAAMREEANEERKKLYPGVESGECDKIVAYGPDGKPVFCRHRKTMAWVYQRTGEQFLQKCGPASDDKVASALDSSGAEDKWLATVHERCFAFTVP